MTTGHVQLDELDAEGVVCTLSDGHARALAGTGLLEVRPEGVDRWRLLPRGMVGAVRIGDLQVQVNPKDKVGVQHLLFLLGYAENPGFRPEHVSAEAHDQLWPALAESLARSAERALARGVLQGYRTVDGALRTVQGRIRIGDQISRRPGQVIPLEVTYDEFTVDTAENRILRSALRRMAQVVRVDPAVRRRLLHLETRPEGVSTLRSGQPLPRWLPNRANERYQPALWLAAIVLRNTSARTAPGGLSVASFVVPMWSVFEQFVTVALTEALATQQGRTERQFTTTLDEPRSDRAVGDIRMDIDVVQCDVWGCPTVVYDAKYKVASPMGRYANADHYQMLAYCTALQVPVAWLVYAQGVDSPTRRQVRNSDVTVVEFPLNLAVPPEVLLRQVDELARVSTGQVSLSGH